MPILQEQSSLYPDNLLETLVAEESERRWWVLYTKARQEKAVARDLEGMRIPFFVPLVRKTSVLRGRAVVSQIPLFAGYVFLYGSDEERGAGLTTNRLSRVLSIVDGARLTEDLRRVHRLIASGAPLTMERRLVPGTRVRIRCGALAGMEGVVVRRHGETRLLVSVDFIQQGASIAIDDFLLEPIG